MTFDLIAVGGGFAGLCAAVRATELGLRASVVERGDGEHYMCNSRVSTGVTHVAFLHPDTAEETLYDAIQEAAAGTARDDLARSFAANAGRTLAWLSEHGAEFTDAPHRYKGPPMLAPGRVIRAGLDWERSGPNLFLKELRRRLEIRDAEEGVRRGFQPEDFRLGGEGLLDRLKRGGVHEGELHAELGVLLGKHPVSAAVQVLAGDDVVARFQRGQDVVDGRHAAGEDEAEFRLFEFRDARFQAVRPGLPERA